MGGADLGEHSEEDAVCAEHERRVRPAAVLQPDGVPHTVPHLLPPLTRHSVRHADSTDAARLGAKDAAALPFLPGCVQQKLGHLPDNVNKSTINTQITDIPAGIMKALQNSGNKIPFFTRVTSRI
jgi:hypothetical protein